MQIQPSSIAVQVSFLLLVSSIAASYTVPSSAANPNSGSNRSTPAASNSKDIERQQMFRRVQQARDTFEEEQAILLLTQWLRQHREDEEARMLRAKIYFFVTKYAEAAADYQICTKSKSPTTKGWSTWELGESFERMGKEKEADKAFAAALPMVGNAGMVLKKLAVRARKRGDGKAALQFADQLVAKEFDEGHLQKAEAYMLLKEPQKAIAEYGMLIPNMSKKVERMQTGSATTYRTSQSLRIALDGRAKCYDQIGKHDLAEKDRDYHRQMDRQVFDATPFLKK